MRILQILCSFLLFTQICISQPNLESFLKEQPLVKSVEKLECDEFFKVKYKIMVEQPVDHKNPEMGTFLQRVIIADKGIDRPVVFITEGYNGGYSEKPDYINELSPILEANQICMDHRYFGESWPKPLDWQYLTVRNAAADHHNVVQLLNKYYTGKWISTGISKGGQTVVYHRWLYPNDVDFSVPYVCPLNFGVEDGRHEPFIANIAGTPEGRKKVKDFQTYILKNRALFLPKLEKYCSKEKYTPRLNNNELLDYIVLEYSFAIWQFGTPIDQIPDLGAGTNKLFKHLVEVSSPMYFSDEGLDVYKSFYVQAARELGYYGYDVKPFKKYLSIKSTKGYLNRIYLPKGLIVKYNGQTAESVRKFIQTTDAKILFIYGSWDPWTASGFEVPEKENLLKIVKPEGSHRTRINNLPAEQKQQVKATFEKWLGESVNLM